jgi:hypothetical protein
MGRVVARGQESQKQNAGAEGLKLHPISVSNKIYLAYKYTLELMASSDRRLKEISDLNHPNGDDLVEGVLTGIEDYKAGRVTNFKSKEELIRHLKSL